MPGAKRLSKIRADRESSPWNLNTIEIDTLTRGPAMSTTAADVMSTAFRTLDVNLPMVEAVSRFRKDGRDGSRRVFGMMVTDSDQHLVGMLSMYDVLLFLRPKHIHIWGMMEDIDVDGVVANAVERLKPLRVGDLMTSEVITIAPGAHVMTVLDRMIKKHIRRLPVVEDGRILGIVYISDLFYHLVDRMVPAATGPDSSPPPEGNF